MVDLRVPPKAAGSVATAVDRTGRVAGYVTPLPGSGDSRRAFSWSEEDGMVEVVTPGLDSVATAVNGAGQVVGVGRTSGGVEHAFSWTPGAPAVDLGPGRANDVDEAGRVVGALDTPSGPRAFSWTRDGGLVDLGTPGEAIAVDERGGVVGERTTETGLTRAFLWTPAGGTTELGTLGGETSSAAAVNDAGQVVGSSTTASGETHGFSWAAAGGMTDLGTLGGTTSRAVAVNDAGRIAGAASAADGREHAAVWPDDIPPPAPSRPDLAAGSDSGVASDDDVTSTTSPTLAGTAEPGATVTLYRDSTAVGTATADDDGSWAVGGLVPGDGVFAYTATSTDRAGNVSAPSAPLAVTIDSTAPALNVTGGPSGGRFTLPALPPRPRLAASDAGSGIAYAQDDWTRPPTVDGAGTYVYRATGVDRAGNASSEMRFYVAVAAPVVAAAPPAAGDDDAWWADDEGDDDWVTDEDDAGPTVDEPAEMPDGPEAPAAPAAPAAQTPRAVVVAAVIGRPTASPRRLLAGKAATVSFTVTRSDTGRPAAGATMSCEPTLGGSRVAHRERLANGVATLRLTLPRSARGKVLKVRLTIRLGARTAARTGTFPVG